ncbi:MAG: hypothetical protein AB7S38_37030 [Vulcanimicrobiota bacterium]
MRSSVVLLTLLLVGCSLPNPDTEERLAAKQAELQHLEQEIRDLPQLTAEMEELDKQFGALHQKIHGDAPLPEMPPYTPSGAPPLATDEDPRIVEIDQQIRQIRAQLPIVQERQARVEWLKEQIARLKTEEKKP